MENIRNHWLTVLLIFIAIGFLVYGFTRVSQKTQPEIIEVPTTDSETLSKYMPDMTISDTKEVSKAIDKAQTTTPTYTYYTINQTTADKTAQAFAKEQKADKLIKTTEETVITEETKVETEDSGKTITLNNGDSLIENKYYAINLEKKHEIKVGAAAIDSRTYATVSYRNRDLTYTAFYSPAHHNGGVAISYTIAKW